MSSPLSQRSALIDALVQQMRSFSAQTVLYSHAVAERLGLHSTDLECIDLLLLNGPLPAGRLAELTGLTTGAVTGVIDRLERAGYARRVSDPTDRRRVVIELVHEQVVRNYTLFEPLKQAWDELYADYDDARLAVLLEFFTRGYPLMQQETARLRQESSAPGEGGEWAAPLAGAARGHLIFATGASAVNLSGDPSLDVLCRARFEGVRPRVGARGGVVKIAYRGAFFDWRPRAARVSLNASIPWQVDLHRGAADVTADLRRVSLSGFEASGGVNRLALSLGQPEGIVGIRIGGGASQVQVHRPRGVAAHLHVSGGASQLRFDQHRIEGAGGGLSWQSAGAEGAVARYDIHISGGASQLTVGEL